MNRDDNNFEFKVCVALLILMMLMVTWFYLDVREAHAAETTDGTYYPDITEIDWGEHEETIKSIVEANSRIIVCKSSSIYRYLFVSEDAVTKIGYNTNHDYSVCVEGVADLSFSGRYENRFIKYNSETGAIDLESFEVDFSVAWGQGSLEKIYVIGSNYDYRCVDSWKNMSELPYNNLTYPTFEDTSQTSTSITVCCSGKNYDIPLEGYKYYFVAYDTSGYAKIYITNTPLTGTENNGVLTIAASGAGDVLTYGTDNTHLSYKKTRSLYADCTFNFAVSNFKYHESNYNFKDSETGEILYTANSSAASGFEEINCGDYAEQLADIVNACDRMYVVQYIGFDGLVRTRYCFLRPGTMANIISSGKVLSGCTYYLPYDYAVTVYEHTVQSVTTLSGTQAFHKMDDITAYMLLGATFDIDLSSILPNYNYNKYSYPAAPEPEEPDEPVVDYTPPTTQELLDALPAEAKFYTDCIILQQEHEDAWTNDIVFYCWNVPEDAMIYLILRWGDSAILAADSDGVVVTGTLKGYWDFATASWVIDAGTIISRTRNSTYSVPKIYYSSANLYRQILSQSENLHDTDSCLYYWVSDNPQLENDPFGAIIEDKGWWADIKRFFRDLFIPRAGYFDSKVSNLKSKFSFYEAVSSTVTAFTDFFTKTEFTKPPVIEVDLSVARSKYNYGTSAIALDMSWYSEYKLYVDVFLSSVMWVVFVWNTFRQLPNIINGVGSGFKALAQSQPDNKSM